jgi:hypothetical protein
MDDARLAVSIVGLGISALAFVLAGSSAMFARRVRQAETFSKLYDQLNTTDFGQHMRQVGRWRDGLRGQIGNREPGMAAAMLAYRQHLDATFPMRSMADKIDPLDDARRILKAWFLKCYLT